MDLNDGWAGSVRPHEDAGSNVADHEGEAQDAGSDSADQAREDNQDEIGCDAQCVQLSSVSLDEGRRAALAIIWPHARRTPAGIELRNLAPV